MTVIAGKTYRVTSQGYGKRKEAKKYIKRRWRRAMNRYKSDTRQAS